MIDIFCPQCGELILDRDTCPTCRWHRDTGSGTIGTLVWQADLGTKLNKPFCFPTIAAGAYCMGTEDGNLLALNPVSGEVLWEYTLGAGTLAHAIATDGQTLYIGAEDVNSIPRSGRPLLAIDAATGKLLWESPTQAHSLSAAAVAEGDVFFTATDGLLRAVDRQNGALHWSIAHPQWGPTAPLVCGDLICVGGRGASIMAYDRVTGRQHWQWHADAWFAYPLAADTTTLYALAWDGHLYALDLQDGRVRWEATGERAKGFTTPPTATGDGVVIGSRLNQEYGGEPKSGYGLVSLDATNGVEQWRCYVDRHIQTPVAVADDQVFFATNDSNLYAAQLDTGSILWQVEVTSRAVTLPLVKGDLTIYGGRDGMVHAVRRRQPPATDIHPPKSYLSQGAYADAAAAYALDRRFACAAELFAEHVQDLDKAIKLYRAADQPDQAAPLLAKMERHKEAAQCYEEAGDMASAALAWEHARDYRRARDLYGDLNDQVGRARVLERLGDFLEAAQIHKVAKEWAEAARLFELGEDLNAAAEMYIKLGEKSKAIDVWNQLEQWDRSVSELEADGKHIEAAHILENNQQLRRARDYYRKAHALADVMRLSIKLEDWESVAKTAEALHDYAQAAEAWERVPNYGLAATAYVEAGKLAREQQPTDEARIADYYEHACRLYSSRVFDEERERACRHMVKQYRHLPDLSLQLTSTSGFIENQFNLLNLIVTNKGGGVARDIRFRIVGGFDVDDYDPIPYLPKEGRRQVKLPVRPRQGYVGPAVPLRIIITYRDSRGRLDELSTRLSVEVAAGGPLGGLLRSTTPLNINIQELYQNSNRVNGDYMEGGAQKAEGDVLNGEAQKGDRVEISRPSHANGTGSGPRVVVREGIGPVRRCPICNVPTTDGTQRYCEECGAPLPKDTAEDDNQPAQ